MKYAKFTRPLTVALTPHVYDILKEKSESEKISIAELVRYILGDAVSRLLKNDESQNKIKESKGSTTNDNTK